MSPTAWKLGCVVLYFAALLWIGVVASRRVRGLADFFVGGKRLGYWFIAFSARATGESGWLLLGLTGTAFLIGAHALWIYMGEMLGVVLLWTCLAKRFKRLTDRYEAITVTDFLEVRFRDRRHGIRWLCTLVICPFMLCYAAAQLLYTGEAFHGFFGISVPDGMLIGVAILFAYTVAGGFVAVVWSDLVQGALMLAGLVLLPAVAQWQVGGVGALLDALQGIDPHLLSPLGTNGAIDAPGWTWPNVLSVVGLVGIGLGYLGVPQVFVRFIGIRDVGEIRNGSLVATVWTLLADLGAIVAGMCGRVIYLRLRNPESETLPFLAEDLFHPALTGFFVAVVLAAIMSTADSLLVLAASALVRDTYQKIFRPAAPDGRLAGLSRWVTLGLCLVALLLAFGAYQGVTLRNADLAAGIEDWSAEDGDAFRLLLEAPPEEPGDRLRRPVARLQGTVRAAPYEVPSGRPYAVHLHWRGEVGTSIEAWVEATAARLEAGGTGRWEWLTLDAVGGSSPHRLAIRGQGALIDRYEVKSTGKPFIFWFVLFAWSGLASSFGPPIILGLIWRGATRAGCVAGLLTGTLVTILWKQVPFGPGSWLQAWAVAHGFVGEGDAVTLSAILYEIVPAFLLSMLAVWLVSLLTRPPEEAGDDLASIG